MSLSYRLALAIVKKLDRNGFVSYFAGGWVRDFLLDHPSDDIDIVTEASVEVVQDLFDKTIPVGVQFGIVIVVMEGISFEVATFRKEIGHDGRRPLVVQQATAREDAQRRDFTINGLFYDPIEGRLFDYVNGTHDLKKRLIRAIGNPHDRFLEDRLRMVRAVRYADRFSFSLEKRTLLALLEHAEELMGAVSIERIVQEFEKIAARGNLTRALELLHQFGLLQTIFPSLKTISIEIIRRRLIHLPKLIICRPPLIILLLELFPHADQSERRQICRYLKLSKCQERWALFLGQVEEALLKEKLIPLWKWVSFYIDPLWASCFELGRAKLSVLESKQVLARHVKRYHKVDWAVRRLKKGERLLSVDSLRAAGVVDGPALGKLLVAGERLAIEQGLIDESEIMAALADKGLV